VAAAPVSKIGRPDWAAVDYSSSKPPQLVSVCVIRITDTRVGPVLSLLFSALRGCKVIAKTGKTGISTRDGPAQHPDREGARLRQHLRKILQQLKMERPNEALRPF
jgi:hypothetical protein